MLYAEIRWSGKIIAAVNASRYEKYRCPTCKAAVFLKSGRVYTTHFAHMPGRGKPECENYHPPEDLRRGLAALSPQQTRQKIEGLLLGIELEPDHDARSGLRRWILRVTVPKSYDSRGTIRINLGGGDTRTISLSTLIHGSKTYRADPAAVEFGAASFSPEVASEYCQAFKYPIVGLNPMRATVFGVVPQKIKPQCNSLRWGGSYYFVWHTDRSIELPSSLPHHSLADNRGWACCLLKLPDRADPDIAEWLEKTCDLQVISAKREWALIYPQPYGVDDDGQLQFPFAAKLLLALKSIEEPGEITCVSGQQSASLQLSDSGLDLLEIGIEQKGGDWPIHLAWDSLPLNSLFAREYPDSMPEPAIVFEFGQVPDKKFALHHRSCLARLLRVRTTEDQVSGLRGDYRISGVLRHRRVGEFEWQILELDFPRPESATSAGHTFLPGAKIAHINSLLKDCSLDIAIDFGPYGMFFSNAIAAKEVAQSCERLPRRLRARIEWLCKAAQVFVDTKGKSVTGLNDAALLRHLSTIKIPVSLLANKRAIERALSNIEARLPI